MSFNLKLNEIFSVAYDRKYITIKEGRLHYLEWVKQLSSSVNRHIISNKKGNEKSYCGKIYLPMAITRKAFKKCRLFALSYPVHINGTSQWGVGFLLFLEDNSYDSGHCFDIRTHFNIFDKEHKTKSLSRHMRKSKGRIYISYKCYLPKKFIKCRFGILRVKPIAFAHLGYNQERRGQTDYEEKLKGRAYLIFVVQNHSQIRKKIAYMKENPFPKRHEKTLLLLKQELRTGTISKITKYSENTIWNHIIKLYKEEQISPESLRKILRVNVSIVDNVVIELSEFTRQAEERVRKMRVKDQILEDKYLYDAYKDLLSTKNITTHYLNKYQVKLMPNLARCISMIYSELLTKRRF